MVDISKIMAYLSLINTDGDKKITQEEIDEAGDKVPSVFLSRLSTMANGKDISVERVLQGLGVENNPENKPVTGYNDKRPAEPDDWSWLFVRLDKVPTKEDYRKDFQAKDIYDVNLPLDKPLSSDLDFSNSLWLLQESSFNETTFANTPKEHLPEGYDPKKVIELGKDPGLNARKVHDKGVTGKGVNIALMDWALLNSDNYDENIVSYSSAPRISEISETMHGCAVASILAGKETGVAPDANVYYFAEKHSGGNDQDMILSFQRMLEINKNLPDDEKIRVVSISGTPYGGEEMNKLLEQAKKDGIWVMSSPEFWENFGYLGRVNPMGDPDDFNNYKIQRTARKGRQLYVNSGNRTVTNNTVEGGYRHDSKASASWAIPVVAGYYALACQVDPSITPERFLELADETAQTKEVDVPFDLEQEKVNSLSRIGVYSVLPEFIKEKKPQMSDDEIRAFMVTDEGFQYQLEFEESLKREGIEHPDEYFISIGEKLLEENGQDVMDLVKLPENSRTNIKIVDIDALINKLQEDKIKKAE